MDNGLALRRNGSLDEVGVAVSSQQQNLKEQHAGRPEGECAAKPRQNIVGDDGLYLEEEK